MRCSFNVACPPAAPNLKLTANCPRDLSSRAALVGGRHFVNCARLIRVSDPELWVQVPWRRSGVLEPVLAPPLVIYAMHRGARAKKHPLGLTST